MALSETVYQFQRNNDDEKRLIHHGKHTWKYVSKETWCLTSTETIRLIRDGEKEGKGEWRSGKSETIYLSLHCHHQNDFCIKVGNDESHFNVS